MMLHRLFLLLLIFLALPVWAADTLVLGVFAYRPKEILTQRFQPLADYLGTQLGDVRIELRVLKQDEIEAALAAKQLDLVFTNPSHYVVVRSQFKLTGALATLISEESGQPTNQLGGVVITRADNDSIRSLADLKGRQLIVPGTKFLGGYQTQAFELLEAGIRLPQDAQIKDVGAHDGVVNTILAGEGDAGFIRTGLIEQMVAEGKLDAARLRVINRQDFPDFPYRASTRLYPEWAFVALPHVDSQRVRKIAAALMSLEASHPAARAAGIAGFAPPHDYLPVENIMRALRSPPFDKVTPITLGDIWKQHHLTVMVLLASLMLVSLLLVLLLRRNRQIEHAREAAEAANVAKSRFLATMSHEIRTPMNGILGMAQLLVMDGLTEKERHDYARVILNSGQTLLTLLNDILDLSKIEAGRIELAHAAFEPHQLIEETVALFHEQAHARDLVLKSICQLPAGRRYWADPTRLRQMLSNLVSNAIKFTPRGFVHVEVAEVVSAGDDAQVLLEFAVSDSGIGVPDDKQSLLFKPFSQVDNSNTRQFGGTGLGLSIIRSLAQLMGGDVGFTSEAGKGSRFWFRICATVVGDDEESRHNARSASDAESSACKLAGRVLVVEDNAVNRKVIEALLTRLGVSVRCVENGQLAVEALAAGEAPDLVLMDMQMPVMDGLTATRAIRRQEGAARTPRLPIVALTAGAFEDDRQHCLEAGMDDFLAKPVNLKDLEAMLAKWLPGRPAHGV
ncbi:MAG: PhnD/SsuA/transferrin family substrate-binding protein [Rhodocyclaceae bacterium]|nr:PhnD/SsuA/transferrin family substrate-binding protein [Rhodocyclaceae bacterium]MDZ4214928.1 PhnD/SsuA/transferrin family substrate-binding protein [Rhodocyclaceae bacterium]